MGVSWNDRKRILYNWKGWYLMIGWIGAVIFLLLIIEVFYDNN